MGPIENGCKVRSIPELSRSSPSRNREERRLTLELKLFTSLEVEDVVSHDSSGVVLDEKFLDNHREMS